MKDTSFESSEKWYDDIVGEKGHYYHQNLVIPRMLELYSFSKEDRVLDLGCGQGVFLRHLPEGISYTGVDLSKGLIAKAKDYAKSSSARFICADVCQDLPIKEKDFTVGVMVLCLQNMEFPNRALHSMSSHLKKGGKCILVLNHPAFRIPRQSSWGIDEKRKLQYREVFLYMSSQKIPIMTNPGKSDSSHTYSFHNPISFYIQILAKEGFVVEGMEEWCSDKTSVGGRARMENRARKEFPLFLAIVASKVR